ncbi:MAG: FAD-dependent monooxygenase [Rhodopila sp.]
MCIVGYGPTGATLANLLGQARVSTLVVERQAAPYDLPRAVGFDAEVMRIFQTVGLADRIYRSLRSRSGRVSSTGSGACCWNGLARRTLGRWAGMQATVTVPAVVMPDCFISAAKSPPPTFTHARPQSWRRRHGIRCRSTVRAASSTERSTCRARSFSPRVAGRRRRR